MVQEEGRTRLTDQIKKLNELMEVQQQLLAPRKRSKFKLPSKLRKATKRKLKQNKILVLRITTNGNIHPEFLPVNDELVYIKENKTYHSASAEYVMRFNNKFPTIILPEWSLMPFVPRENKKETRETGTDAIPQKVIITAMKQAQAGLLKKGGFGGKTILFIILGVIAALYLLSKIFGG